jgi:hypothetical protein
MGAASAGVQSPQSSMPAGKGAGASPSTPAGSVNSTTMSATSGQPTVGAPNTNSNTGLGLAAAGKGGGSSYAAPTSPYIAEPQSFMNLDASGNPVTPSQVPNQYSNTIGAPNEMSTGAPVPTGVSGKGGAAGGSQGKGPQ